MKDILVHVEDSARTSQRIRYGVMLAEAFGARLTGAFVVAHPRVPGYVAAAVGDVTPILPEDAVRACKQAEKAFAAATKGSTIEARWTSAHGEVAEELDRLGRNADFVILGAPDKDGNDGIETRTDGIVFSCGRPILYLPDSFEPRLPDRVLIAWNGSREAARAVHDALPLLRKAREVRVLCINGRDEKPASPAEIADHLRRHSIAVIEEKADAGGRAVWDVLNEGARARADLLVMGAYSKAPWHERLWGGATDHMLRNSAVPLLMAH